MIIIILKKDQFLFIIFFLLFSLWSYLRADWSPGTRQ